MKRMLNEPSFGLPQLLPAVLIGLVSCTGGTGEAPLEVELLETTQQAITQWRSGGTAPPAAEVSRELLDSLDYPLLEVRIERRDVLAYLGVQTERHDGQPGKVVVWRTRDDATLALRNGMLISTRGLGGDIVSAYVPARGDAPGPSVSGAQFQMIRSGGGSPQRLTLVCDLADLGIETIEIIGHQHATQHLRQRCEAESGGRVTNDYWVEPMVGLVWQSRQWAGPYIGYLQLRLVRN